MKRGTWIWQYPALPLSSEEVLMLIGRKLSSYSCSSLHDLSIDMLKAILWLPFSIYTFTFTSSDHHHQIIITNWKKRWYFLIAWMEKVAANVCFVASGALSDFDAANAVRQHFDFSCWKKMLIKDGRPPSTRDTTLKYSKVYIHFTYLFLDHFHMYKRALSYLLITEVNIDNVLFNWYC